ncbi:uncharacterized protein EI90DRAFT_1189281 [Cantharellus anzutake]|uniref:uncharacterized protein n=1 Tax=Cantharellus anzutake TaxID=1750568 RepID=UPI001903AAA3|nr:uncharacterized protein EI90DRAFT_1189281 [Cantharellus anzutake]KAF8330421.1 hypothetical protein EI90DRAFT_1189281 [Cantharellus anzutake]
MNMPSPMASNSTRWFWKTSSKSRSSGQKETNSTSRKKPSVFRAFRSGSSGSKPTRSTIEATSTSSSSELSASSSSSSYVARPKQQARPSPTINIAATSHLSQAGRLVQTPTASNDPSAPIGPAALFKAFKINDDTSPSRTSSERRLRSQTVGGQTLESRAADARARDLVSRPSQLKPSTLLPQPVDGARARILSISTKAPTPTSLSFTTPPSIVTPPRSLSTRPLPASAEPLVQGPLVNSTHTRQLSTISAASSLDDNIVRRSRLAQGESHAGPLMDETVPFKPMSPDARASALSFGSGFSAGDEELRRKPHAGNTAPLTMDMEDTKALHVEHSNPLPRSSTPSMSLLSIDSHIMTSDSAERTPPQPTIHPIKHALKLSPLSILVPSRSKSIKKTPPSSSPSPLHSSSNNPIINGASLRLKKQRSFAPSTPTNYILDVERPTLRHYSSVEGSPSSREKKAASIKHLSSDVTTINSTQRDLVSLASPRVSVNGFRDGPASSPSSSRPLSPSSVTPNEVDSLPISTMDAPLDNKLRRMPSIDAVAASVVASSTKMPTAESSLSLTAELNAIKSRGREEDEDLRHDMHIVSPREVALLLELDPEPRPDQLKKGGMERGGSGTQVLGTTPVSTRTPLGHTNEV